MKVTRSKRSEKIAKDVLFIQTRSQGLCVSCVHAVLWRFVQIERKPGYEKSAHAENIMKMGCITRSKRNGGLYRDASILYPRN